MNFVSTPWKIKIPLGKSVGDHIWAIYVYMGRWVGGGDVDGGGVGVGGEVGYYNLPRSTNNIKSFDEILISEKNYIILHFSVVGESQT